jgi:hypothetical protein
VLSRSKYTPDSGVAAKVFAKVVFPTWRAPKMATAGLQLRKSVIIELLNLGNILAFYAHNDEFARIKIVSIQVNLSTI